MTIIGLISVVLLHFASADEVAVELPWYSLAVAKAMHYIPVYNPMVEREICGIDFGKIDLVNLLGGKVGASFPIVEQQCLSHGVRDMRLVKVRLGFVDSPERGYDQPSVECLHLFKLDESAHTAPPPRAADSRYGPPRFPRAFYVHSRVPEEASVCVSEYLEGVPIAWHVSSLQTDSDVADFALAMLELGATLSRHSILHRDVHTYNLMVHRDGEEKFRIVLLDFTWALSPGIVQFSDPPEYLNDIYGRRPEPSDAYSIGFLLHDLLSMYCPLDTSWLSPVVSALLEAPPQRNLSFAADYDALAQTVLDLLPPLPARGRASSSAAAQDPLAERRLALCDRPNSHAPPPSIEAGYAMVGSSAQPAVSVTGYQQFSLYRTEAGGLELSPRDRGLRQKDQVLAPVLNSIMKGLSVVDVGGNFGYFCARSMLHGASAATVVEMDRDHSLIAKEMYDYIGEPVSKIKIQNMKLKDIPPDGAGYTADIVLALAFIHWSYNCSESNGSLAKTIGQLALRARKLLIVEWVDPMDDAIQRENHLGTGFDWTLQSSALNGDPDYDNISIKNTSLTSLTHSQYSFDEFRRVMGRMFDCVREIGRVTPTRRIFVGVRGRGRSLDQRGEVHEDIYKGVHEYFRTTFGCVTIG